MAAKKKSYSAKLVDEGAIPVPFDPETVFGKVRAPVKVTINGYTYRSTIARMGGADFIPFRKSNREAAGVDGLGTIKVALELDEEKREVEAPADLVKALKKSPGAWAAWQKLSYSHQKEHADAIVGAKKPETRERRIAKAVAMLSK